MFRRRKKVEQGELFTLEEFGIAFMEIDGRIKEIMKKKNTNEIRKILETIKRLKKNNCWNAVYRVREFIKNAGIEELKARVPQIKIEVKEQANTEITEEDMEKIDTKDKKIDIKDEDLQ
jgi:hypothetical protein